MMEIKSEKKRKKKFW